MLPGTSTGFPFFMSGGLTLRCCRDPHMENPRNTKNMSGLHSKCRGSPVSHAHPHTGNIYSFGIPHRNGEPSGITIPATLQGCWQHNPRAHPRTCPFCHLSCRLPSGLSITLDITCYPLQTIHQQTPMLSTLWALFRRLTKKEPRHIDGAKLLGGNRLVQNNPDNQ